MAAWANFFMVAAGVAAILAGLIVVAVAVSLQQILKYPHLPPRMRATFSNLMPVMMTGLLGLVPHPVSAFAAEVVVFSAIGWTIVIACQREVMRAPFQGWPSGGRADHRLARSARRHTGFRRRRGVALDRERPRPLLDHGRCGRHAVLDHDEHLGLHGGDDAMMWRARPDERHLGRRCRCRVDRDRWRARLLLRPDPDRRLCRRGAPHHPRRLRRRHTERSDGGRRTGRHRGACRCRAPMVGGAWRGAGDDRCRGLPRPDADAPARNALHLADRRRCDARAVARRAGRQRHAQRRCGGRRAGRAAGAGLPCRAGARPRAAARRREYRRRRQRHLDRRGRIRCWRSTPAPATGRSTTGARGAPASASTATARWRHRARSTGRAWSAGSNTATSRASRPSRSTAATSTTHGSTDCRWPTVRRR